MSRTVAVGLIADPGLPEKIAGRLSRDLSRRLADEADGSIEWRIAVSGQTLGLAANGEIPLAEQAPRLLEEHGWDGMVYLTDLPRRHHDEPILAEFSAANRAVLVSLPALGGWRVTDRTRALLVPLLLSLADRSEGAQSANRTVHGAASEYTSDDGDRYLLRPGSINRWRLLAGMVRNNRPGRLLPALSSTGAAGIGTGAFGIFYASIWNMADSLSSGRLAAISALVIAALSFWLIFYNGLWTRKSGTGQGHPWLDNAATIVTVGVSAALMYVALYLGLLAGALAIITPDYLASQLQRPVSLADHLRLSWLAASLGTIGGAIGSNFDSDLSEATYSRREHERRQRTDS